MLAIGLGLMKKLDIRKRKTKNDNRQKHFGCRKHIAQFPIKFHIEGKNKNRRERPQQKTEVADNTVLKALSRNYTHTAENF